MKYYFAAFVIGVIVGIAISFLFCTSLNNTPSTKPIANVTTELKKEVAKSEVNYSKAVDSLRKQSVKLQSELTDTKTELSRAKQKNYSLQLTIYDLIDRQADSKQALIGEPNNNCDSLIVTVEQFMQSSSEKDSLYEKVTLNLEDQVRNKDSTLAIKDKQYMEVKMAFDKSLQSSNEVLALNKQLNKHVKRQKFKSKILTAALFILTGAAANCIIHH